MTAERIAYFEKVLSKPQPEPHASWLRELFEAAKGQDKPAFKASKSLYVTPKAEPESVSDSES
jgi:hypothetical protein